MLHSLDKLILLAIFCWPIAAAGVIYLLRRGRRSVMAAATVQLALVVIAWLRSAAGADLEYISDWVRMGVGVDFWLRITPVSGLALLGASLCLVWAVCLPDPRDDARRRGYYEALLLVSGAQHNLLLAGDMLLMLLAVPALLAAGIAMSNRWSISARMRGDMRIFTALYVAWLVLMAATFRWAWLHYQQSGMLSFAVDDLLTFQPNVRDADGLWVMLLAGAAALFGLSGGYWIVRPLARSLPPAGRLLMTGCMRWAGTFVIMTVLLPMWPRGGEASHAPWVMLAIIAAVGLVLAALDALRRRFRDIAPIGRVIGTSGILVLILLDSPWMLLLAAALAAVELGLSIAQAWGRAGLRQIPRPARLWSAAVTAAAIAAAVAGAIGPHLWSGFEELVRLSHTVQIYTRGSAFAFEPHADTGLLSMLGLFLWVLGVLSIRPFARVPRRQTSRSLFWRLAGPVLIQLGLAMFLFDGVWNRPPPEAAPYYDVPWLTHLPRAAVYVGLHAALIVGITGSVVIYLRRGGMRLRRLEDISGIGASHPWAAAALAIAALSVFGLPLTGGFWNICILFAFRTAWHSRALLGLPLLFVLPVAGFAAVDQMQMLYRHGHNPSRPPPPACRPLDHLLRVAIAVQVTALLLLGLLPQVLMEPLRLLLGP